MDHNDFFPSQIDIYEKKGLDQHSFLDGIGYAL